MNTKRVIFWICFVAILGLIIWGLIVAMNKPVPGSTLGEPAPIGAADHVRGPANASTTLIEYGDFQCPACRTYYPIVERLFASASTSMKMVFRHFPLSQHANAIPAAIVAEAASRQDKFWEMYHQLYENQDEWAEVLAPTPLFEKYAELIGLDMEKFKIDEKDAALKALIIANQDDGIHIGINQTPTFFVNNKSVAPQNYDEFKAIIDAAAKGGSN